MGWNIEHYQILSATIMHAVSKEKKLTKKANITNHHTQKEVLKSNTSGVQGRMDNIYPQMEAAGTKFAVQ
jgi:hypothetical protein